MDAIVLLLFLAPFRIGGHGPYTPGVSTGGFALSTGYAFARAAEAAGSALRTALPPIERPVILPALTRPHISSSAQKCPISQVPLLTSWPSISKSHGAM